MFLGRRRGLATFGEPTFVLRDHPKGSFPVLQEIRSVALQPGAPAVWDGSNRYSVLAEASKGETPYLKPKSVVNAPSSLLNHRVAGPRLSNAPTSFVNLRSLSRVVRQTGTGCRTARRT